MRFFSKSHDGGKDSGVTGFFVIEIKSLFSIVILRFSPGSREKFHSHAFNALTWWLKGDVTEMYAKSKETKQWLPSWRPKSTPKNLAHKIVSNGVSWAISFRGPWDATWQEYDDKGDVTTLGHGRVVLEQKRLDNSDLIDLLQKATKSAEDGRYKLDALETHRRLKEASGENPYFKLDEVLLAKPEDAKVLDPTSNGGDRTEERTPREERNNPRTRVTSSGNEADEDRKFEDTSVGANYRPSARTPEFSNRLVSSLDERPPKPGEILVSVEDLAGRPLNPGDLPEGITPEMVSQGNHTPEQQEKWKAFVASKGSLIDTDELASVIAKGDEANMVERLRNGEFGDLSNSEEKTIDTLVANGIMGSENSSTTRFMESRKATASKITSSDLDLSFGGQISYGPVLSEEQLRDGVPLEDLNGALSIPDPSKNLSFHQRVTMRRLTERRTTSITTQAPSKQPLLLAYDPGVGVAKSDDREFSLVSPYDQDAYKSFYSDLIRAWCGMLYDPKELLAPGSIVMEKIEKAIAEAGLGRKPHPQKVAVSFTWPKGLVSVGSEEAGILKALTGIPPDLGVEISLGGGLPDDSRRKKREAMAGAILPAIADALLVKGGEVVNEAGKTVLKFNWDDLRNQVGIGESQTMTAVAPQHPHSRPMTGVSDGIYPIRGDDEVNFEAATDAHLIVHNAAYAEIIKEEEAKTAERSLKDHIEQMSKDNKGSKRSLYYSNSSRPMFSTPENKEDPQVEAINQIEAVKAGEVVKITTGDLSKPTRSRHHYKTGEMVSAGKPYSGIIGLHDRDNSPYNRVSVPESIKRIKLKRPDGYRLKPISERASSNSSDHSIDMIHLASTFIANPADSPSSSSSYSGNSDSSSSDSGGSSD